MSDTIVNSILSCLSQQGIDVSPYPDGGFDAIDVPGFYYDPSTARIDHFSELCSFNYAMVDHYTNAKNLVRDGFFYVPAFDDIDHLTKNMIMWKNHLIAKGIQ